MPIINLLPFRCLVEPRDLIRCIAVQYNIALVLCLYYEISQRESYNDTQHRKILNRSRYEYRSQNLVYSKGYICLRIIYTSIRKPTSHWPTFFLYYRATTICSHSRVKATSTSYTRLHTILIIYLYILHIHVTHPPSLNIAVIISRRQEISKHPQLK